MTDSSARKGPVALAIGLSVLYVLVFVAPPPVSGPAWLSVAADYPVRTAYALIDGALRLATGEQPAIFLRLSFYLLLMVGLVPWLLLVAVGRGRPRDVGFRYPNRYAWRFLLVGFVCSVPFQVWMVRGPGFADSYLEQLERAGAATFVFYYGVNMLTEHAFLHGMILAACRPGHRWPPAGQAARGKATSANRLLRWIGLAQPTGAARGLRWVTRWIGLPDGCIPAIITSTFLFGLGHWEKDPRELMLSVPGGLALAYVAYRSNSWLTTFALHLATAGAAFVMIVAMH